jgi:hypothetical protein
MKDVVDLLSQIFNLMAFANHTSVTHVQLPIFFETCYHLVLNWNRNVERVIFVSSLAQHKRCEIFNLKHICDTSGTICRKSYCIIDKDNIEIEAYPTVIST